MRRYSWRVRLWQTGRKDPGRPHLGRELWYVCRKYVRAAFLAISFLPCCALAITDLSGFNPLPYVEQTRITQGPYAGGYLIAPYGYLNWYFVNLGLIPFVRDIPAHVKTYLNLYIKNLTPQFNIRDVIFDFTQGGVTGPVQFQRQDSDDSYAATFLSLAVAYTRITGDTAWFNANILTLKKIADNNLVNSEYPSSGLTHVFQQQSLYDLGYLEDNCEVYRGLKDFADYL